MNGCNVITIMRFIHRCNMYPYMCIINDGQYAHMAYFLYYAWTMTRTKIVLYSYILYLQTPGPREPR